MKLQCPHCKTSFQVDENDYAAIVAQVKNAEFEAELQRRLQELDAQHKAEDKARALEAEQKMQQRLVDKDQERNDLEKEVERLKAVIANYDAVKKAEEASAAAQKVQELNELSISKDKEIADLKNRLELADKQRELDVIQAQNACNGQIHEKEQAITELSSKLEAQELAAQKEVLELGRQHAALIKAKDEEIEHYKDMKSRLSTKLLGETLEQHCQNMFNRARSQGQYPNAYFEKDNDTRPGSTKGDFIFRDYFNGEEYISIMFEMKNEDDLSTTKQHNEHFFAKLDKDRREKNCEYAILVSTLEADNELYNEGIVDVSYRYPKMLVIRPQFFMSVIALLSRTALRGAERLISLQQELAIAQAQTVDVTKFEQRRDQFVANFGKLVEAHIKKQDDALTGIDKAIEAAEKQAENLRKIKSLFEASRQKLIKANECAENDFTIKKLCHGNPTMRAKFEETRQLEGHNTLLTD